MASDKMGQAPGLTPVLRLQNITKRFGSVTANDDVSFDLFPGEVIALLGENGAGKSTLVSLLLRFDDPERGRILIDGQPITGVTQDSLRAQIGVVTQNTALVHRSVRANILYGNPLLSINGMLVLLVLISVLL